MSVHTYIYYTYVAHIACIHTTAVFTILYAHTYTGMHMYVCICIRFCVRYQPCLPAGLDKLVEASTSVAELSEELVVKEKELAVASEKADHVLQEVTKKAHAAEKVKIAVQKVKDKAQALVDEIEAEKAVAQTKLAAAKPALDEAESALQVCAYCTCVLYVHSLHV